MLVNELQVMKKGVLGWQSRRSLLKSVIVLMLVLGVFFRFVNLDHKVYWVDEAYTSLRISGYTEAELVQGVFTGKEIGVADLQRYQHPSPEKTWGDAFQAFIGNAEHSPLYFILARSWVQFWGYSVANIRALSALISLLVFPCLYWLCRELFAVPIADPSTTASITGSSITGSSITGSSITASTTGSSPVTGIALALVAISPLHVLYAQEARQYSLLTVATLLSSAALLWAMRTRTRRSWAVYGGAIALGLYSHLLFGLVALAHACYVAIMEKFRLSTTVRNYLVSAAGGVLAFLPWLTIALLNLERIQTTTASLTLRYQLSYVVDRWFRNLNQVFADQDLGTANVVLVLLVSVALYFICRTQPRRVWLFVLLLVAVTSLTLAFPDVIWGGQRSLRVRYLIPTYLGIQIAVAYFLSTLITRMRGWQQKFGRVTLTTLLFAGFLGCCMSSQAEVWWNKSLVRTSYYPSVAQIINEAEQPLLVSDSAPIDMLSFSYELKPEVRLQLASEARQIKRLANAENIFLFNPSNALKNRLAKRLGYRLTPAYSDRTTVRLWRLEPKPSQLSRR
jgi:uncharacterized membrane protein